MSTVFMETLKPIITISKVFGLIHFCCTLEICVLCRDMTSTYNIFLEVLRTFVFLIASIYIFLNMKHSYILKFNVIRYWTLIIAARISEKWIIKYDIILFNYTYTLFNILKINLWVRQLRILIVNLRFS